MLQTLFRESIENFPNVLLSNRIKLADITDPTDVIELSDDDIFNNDYHFPKKYELETLRYWRKMGLLPFFEHSKHAYISIAQLMWLRFLQELKNMGAHISTLKEANQYFIERGYRDEVARNNLLELKKNLLLELESQPNNEKSKKTLKDVEYILNDRLLKYSIQIDFNYFNLNIIDHVINGTEVLFAITSEIVINKETKKAEKKQVFSVIRNHPDKNKTNTILDKDPVNFFDFKERKLKKPAIILPANYFIEDIFGDCNISDNAFNIKILTKTEKNVFTEIKSNNLKEISINGGKTEIFSIMENNGTINKENIKAVKIIMGTKRYKEGSAKLINGESISFNPNDYSKENLD
jgi:DNA-binding transcriptional MerR regulator